MLQSFVPLLAALRNIRLYGITMQEKGVSTLVSVDLLEDQLEK